MAELGTRSAYKQAVHRCDVDFWKGTRLQQRCDGACQGAADRDHVIDEQGGTVLHLPDHLHHAGGDAVLTAFVNDGHRRDQPAAVLLRGPEAAFVG